MQRKMGGCTKYWGTLNARGDFQLAVGNVCRWPCIVAGGDAQELVAQRLGSESVEGDDSAGRRRRLVLTLVLHWRPTVTSSG